MFIYIFFFKGYGDHRDLHSFPTRRSSDLVLVANHAPFTWGPDPMASAHNAAVLEFVARMAYFTLGINAQASAIGRSRSEEHTSELQSHVNLVCRLLLEKKN